jgi:hypothetical protein
MSSAKVSNVKGVQMQCLGEMETMYGKGSQMLKKELCTNSNALQEFQSQTLIN